MRRTLLAFTPAALVVALTWLRLESPARDGGLALWLVALAFLPFLARRWWTRAAALGGATLLALGSALDVSPLEAPARFREGFLPFYDERVPFDPAEQPDMAGVLLLAVFAFSVALALAVVTRRPAGAAAVLVVGAGWPATIREDDADLARGGLILAAALVLLAALRRTSLRHALVTGSVLVAAAVGASTSGAVDRNAFLEWERWDLYDAAPKPVSVAYVWNAQYSGIRFPERKTTVLKVEAGPEHTYWRATTLDTFDGERWIEDRPPRVAALTSGDRVELTLDPLLPRAAHDQRRWRRQVVTVEALQDDHLVAASVPVAFDGVTFGARYGWGGVVDLDNPLPRGVSYTAWSYRPRPAARTLARLGPDYPMDELRRGRYLRANRYLSVRRFGMPGRHRALMGEFRTGFLPRAYRPLYLKAREVVGNPRTPYGAVVALESWFRRNGGFIYDEQPGATGTRTPLVDFVLARKRGYCQHFAGAMALMLRYLGIPARVAVGFTSGDYDERRSTWTVTDHDAHAWVEAWFPRYGWLPFDPTPARGQLSGGYTYSSGTFSASPDVFEALGGGVAAQLLRREQLEERRLRAQRAAARGLSDQGRAVAPLIPLAAIGVVLLLVVAKDARRRARYLRRDPQALARGARGELAGFLADQGVLVPASATPAEVAALVEERYGVRAEALARLLSAARYGRDARAAMRLRRELRMVERALRRRLSLGARVRGLLSLRSLRVA